MVQMVVVNGFPRSGKSTFVALCLELLGKYGREISTVDFVKEVAMFCGWDGVKDAKSRKFLSDLKKLLTEWDEVPMKKITKAYEELEREVLGGNMPGFLFVHCREPEEILRLQEQFGAVAVLIEREEVENLEQSNSSDANVKNFAYEYVIRNNGSIQDLRRLAELFMQGLVNI